MKKYLWLFISIIVISMLCAFQTETKAPADDSTNAETSADSSKIYNLIIKEYYRDTELIGKKQPLNNQRLTDTLSEYQDKEHKL